MSLATRQNDISTSVIKMPGIATTTPSIQPPKTAPLTVPSNSGRHVETEGTATPRIQVGPPKQAWKKPKQDDDDDEEIEDLDKHWENCLGGGDLPPRA